MSPSELPLVWDDRYAIGSDLVDGQHRRLFELLAMLHETNHEHNTERETAETELVDHAVNALYGYIRFHFADEERLMEEMGYSGLEAHRRQHDAFILAYDDLVSNYRYADDFVARLSAFIQGWLANHILNEDRKICCDR